MSKFIKKIMFSLLSLFLATLAIYWFNIENKLIYHVIRPLLNKNYDKQNRDVKI